MELRKSKIGEKFSSGIAMVVLSMAVVMLAFVSEKSQITGFVVNENQAVQLTEFENVNSLATLAAGNYYIDSEGIVYWLDDSSKPAIAKIKYLDESQMNRHIYIDDEGRIGYVLGTFP